MVFENDFLEMCVGYLHYIGIFLCLQHVLANNALVEDYKYDDEEELWCEFTLKVRGLFLLFTSIKLFYVERSPIILTP